MGGCLLGVAGMVVAGSEGVAVLALVLRGMSVLVLRWLILLVTSEFGGGKSCSLGWIRLLDLPELG